uniref:hypothetical protein n=1 Tax=Salmonella sp. s54395 TaxID=3159664 RepID=UPI003980DE25
KTHHFLKKYWFKILGEQSVQDSVYASCCCYGKHRGRDFFCQPTAIYMTCRKPLLAVKLVLEEKKPGSYSEF